MVPDHPDPRRPSSEEDRLRSLLGSREDHTRVPEPKVDFAFTERCARELALHFNVRKEEVLADQIENLREQCRIALEPVLMDPRGWMVSASSIPCQLRGLCALTQTSSRIPLTDGTSMRLTKKGLEVHGDGQEKLYQYRAGIDQAISFVNSAANLTIDSIFAYSRTIYSRLFNSRQGMRNVTHPSQESKLSCYAELGTGRVVPSSTLAVINELLIDRLSESQSRSGLLFSEDGVWCIQPDGGGCIIHPWIDAKEALAALLSKKYQSRETQTAQLGSIDRGLNELFLSVSEQLSDLPPSASLPGQLLEVISHSFRVKVRLFEFTKSSKMQRGFELKHTLAINTFLRDWASAFGELVDAIRPVDAPLAYESRSSFPTSRVERSKQQMVADVESEVSQAMVIVEEDSERKLSAPRFDLYLSLQDLEKFEPGRRQWSSTIAESIIDGMAPSLFEKVKSRYLPLAGDRIARGAAAMAIFGYSRSQGIGKAALDHFRSSLKEFFFARKEDRQPNVTPPIRKLIEELCGLEPGRIIDI